MTYSSALFAEGARGLEAAQAAKYRALAQATGIRAGDHVLEIGCGWGGFAEYAARELGARVTGLTISAEQLAFAQKRMADAGLADRVELRFQDYRDETGRYDHVVSIEMFEAVGERYWPVYFDTVRRVLKPGGRAGLQIITIDDRHFEDYRANPDFIQQYIFPGGMLPSLRALDQVTAAAGLETLSCRAFGKDYARTLAIWRERFEEQWDAIAPLGFDDRFRRTWEYYLHYCAAGFRAGNIDVVQSVYAPGR